MKVVRKLAKKQKQEEQAAGAPAWMATFSDLMNLLLCFFVLLFAMSSVDEAKFQELASSFANRLSILSGGRTSIGEGQLINTGVSQLNDLDEYTNDMGQTSDQTGEDVLDLHEQLEQANKEESEEMYDDISSMSSKYDLDDQMEIGVDASRRYITIEISGSLLYASGSAELQSSALPVFSRIGDILKKYKGYRIAIIGHTDNVPVSKRSRYGSNRELSCARANTAADYLVEKKGLDPADIECIGMGEYEPIADNSTTEGRNMNRRIEIRIYNTLNSD